MKEILTAAQHTYYSDELDKPRETNIYYGCILEEKNCLSFNNILWMIFSYCLGNWNVNQYQMWVTSIFTKVQVKSINGTKNRIKILIKSKLHTSLIRSYSKYTISAEPLSVQTNKINFHNNK